jgi:hypothetical protein
MLRPSRSWSSTARATRARTGWCHLATSYIDGREIRVAVLDGSFTFYAYWVADSVELPAAQRDEVRQALVATAQATVANPQEGVTFGLPARSAVTTAPATG